MLHRNQGIDWGVELIFTMLHVRASQTCTLYTNMCFDNISSSDISRFAKPYQNKNKTQVKYELLL